MSRVAIFSGPYPVDDGLGGVGLRLWEIAQLLADAGHEVTIVVPRLSEFAHPRVRFDVFAEDSWRAVVQAHDVVLTTDLPDTRVLLYAHAAGKRLIVENAPPIEHLHYDRLRVSEYGQELYRDLVARWQLQLLLADHLVVRSEAERAANLGALVAVGRMAHLYEERDPALRRFLSLLPIGFTRHAARIAASASPAGSPVDLVWNGGIWDYCSPEPVFDAMAAANAAGHRLTLRLMYACDPDTARRLDQLGLSQLVQWPRGRTTHGQRDGYMKTARAIVITGRRTAESATCHRLRLRDSALYDLPVVVDPYGGTAELVAAYGIGVVADPGDVNGLATALIGATCDGPARTQYLTGLQDNRGRFQMENYIGDVLEFLDSGRHAPDVGSAEHTAAVDELTRSHPTLHLRAPDVV
jgi:glycosyltransferase involved in cell wall biosynthesis